ncbi:hypothetical protein RUM43_008731, partial [Polyplax serrata]
MATLASPTFHLCRQILEYVNYDYHQLLSLCFKSKKKKLPTHPQTFSHRSILEKVEFNDLPLRKFCENSIFQWWQLSDVDFVTSALSIPPGYPVFEFPIQSSGEKARDTKKE